MKFLKKIVWNVLYTFRCVFNPLVRFNEVSVLCYHSISENNHETTVSAYDFDRQLKSLQEAGYIFVSLEDIVAWVEGTKNLPRKAVALTFDDGYEDFKTNAYPLLLKYQAPATVFVIGNPTSTGWRLNEEPPFLSEPDIQEVRSYPLVEVGYHTLSHPNLTKLSPTAIAQQVVPPYPMQFFAYPGGNHSPEAATAVQQAGYRGAFTIHPSLVSKSDNLFLLPRAVILNGMSPHEVLMRVSKAADWYQGLRE